MNIRIFFCIVLLCATGERSEALTHRETEREPVRCLIKSQARTELSSELTGKILKLPIKTGESFNRGDTLVQFDCSLLEAEQERTRARQAAALIKVSHNEQLQKFNSVGALAVDLDKAALEESEAESRIAALAVERCRVLAPFDGRVVQVMVSEYQSVRAQQPLLEILSPERLELKVMVPSDWLVWIKPGLPFRVRVDETGAELDAEVVAVGAAVDPVSRMVMVRGRLERNNPGLVPGMGASAVFEQK